MLNLLISNADNETCEISISPTKNIAFTLLLEIISVSSKSYKKWCKGWRYNPESQETLDYYNNLVNALPGFIRVSKISDEELRKAAILMKNNPKDFNYFDETDCDKYFDQLLDIRFSKLNIAQKETGYEYSNKR
jgi:hypothetical protein